MAMALHEYEAQKAGIVQYAPFLSQKDELQLYAFNPKGKAIMAGMIESFQGSDLSDTGIVLITSNVMPELNASDKQQSIYDQFRKITPPLLQRDNRFVHLTTAAILFTNPISPQVRSPAEHHGARP